MANRSGALLLSALLISSLCMVVNADGGPIIKLKPPPLITHPVLPKGPAVKGPLATGHLPPVIAIRPSKQEVVTLSPGGTVKSPSSLQQADGSLYFKSGKSDLDPASRELLKQFAEQLKGDPNATLAIMGYADRTGTAVANGSLSAKRALEVAAAFESLGIPREKIETYWAGDTYASRGDSRNIDRRTDIIIDSAIDRRKDVLLTIPKE